MTEGGAAERVQQAQEAFDQSATGPISERPASSRGHREPPPKALSLDEIKARPLTTGLTLALFTVLLAATGYGVTQVQHVSDQLEKFIQDQGKINGDIKAELTADIGLAKTDLTKDLGTTKTDVGREVGDLKVEVGRLDERLKTLQTQCDVPSQHQTP